MNDISDVSEQSRRLHFAIDSDDIFFPINQKELYSLSSRLQLNKKNVTDSSE